MTSFLTQVQGFTPLIEVMVQEVGIIQAAVYGVVWRYCQRSDGVCTASHETLGVALGLTRGTVQRHIKELCEAGYLKDTTPERRNRPHVYADTGRAQIVGMVSAKVTVSEKYSTVPENDSQVYQKDTRRESESTKETHVADATPALADEKQKCPRCKNMRILADGFCGECLSIVDSPLGAPADAEQEPRTMLDALVELRDSPPPPDTVTFMSGSPMPTDACPDCHRHKRTTTEMPYKNQTCTCQAERVLADAFGDPPEPWPTVEAAVTPHWREQAAQPGARWGEHSPEFQRQLKQYGENGIMVQSLGGHWQRLTQCPLDWSSKKDVTTWASGLWTCLKAAGGDAGIVLDATRAAIERGLDIANPYSVLKMTQSLVGKRKRGPAKGSGMASGIVYA